MPKKFPLPYLSFQYFPQLQLSPSMSQQKCSNAFSNTQEITSWKIGQVTVPRPTRLQFVFGDPKFRLWLIYFLLFRQTQTLYQRRFLAGKLLRSDMLFHQEFTALFLTFSKWEEIIQYPNTRRHLEANADHYNRQKSTKTVCGEKQLNDHIFSLVLYLQPQQSSIVPLNHQK